MAIGLLAIRFGLGRLAASGAPRGLGGMALARGARAFHGSAVTRHKGCNFGDSEGERAESLRKAMDKYVDDLNADTVAQLRGSAPELEDILIQNKNWVDRMNDEDDDFFVRLGAKQEPKYLYLGCADARVDPGKLMGMEDGKMFVHRNVGNVVSGNDLNILSVIDFAVNYLKVPHILVVGHYDCGAVRGSLGKPEDGGLGGIVENWLRNIRDVARFHKDELMAIEDNEERVRRLVQLNVQEQCLNVLKVGTVQRRRLKNFMRNEYALPRVHGLVFDPSNGVLEKLPIDLKSLAASDQDLYSLYKMPDWLKRTNSMDGLPQN